MNMNYPRIRDLREDCDLSQEKLGEAIHLTQRTYSHYESGNRTIPTHVLCALAEFHKTSVDYLLGLTDERRPYPRKKK